MIAHPDITFIEVDEPNERFCSSGHTAPELFKRGGEGSAKEPTKFFRVKGKSIDIIVCEPCLIIANHIAYLERKNKI